jgi:hypothetical protein
MIWQAPRIFLLMRTEADASPLAGDVATQFAGGEAEWSLRTLALGKGIDKPGSGGTRARWER